MSDPKRESELKNDATGAQNFARARRFERYHYDARMEVLVFREGKTSSLWGRSNELGLDGAGATVSGELSVGEVVTLEFPVPLPPHIMKMRAIVRYNQGLRCGFEFLVLTKEQRETMSRLFERLALSS